MCKQLWCDTEEESECVSKLDPAAKGSKCGKEKVIIFQLYLYKCLKQLLKGHHYN